MPLIQTSLPSVEPVSLSDAKSFLRVDSDLTDDDTLIALLISAARRYAESYCGRSFISQGWRLVLDSFPGPSLMGVPYGNTFSIPAHAIQIERSPLISVDSVTYVAMDGTSMATPFVAAAAALVASRFPTWSGAKIATMLQQTARDLGTAGRDDSFGYGLVQPVAVLTGLFLLVASWASWRVSAGKWMWNFGGAEYPLFWSICCFVVALQS